MYVKLYSKLLDSSIWTDDVDLRLLWITMLLMADREGFVFGSVLGLARRALIPLDRTETALARLMSPDPYSSDGSDGVRVEAIVGGWKIVNYSKYREIESQDDLRYRKKMEARKRRGTMSPDVTRISPSEAEAEAEAFSPPLLTNSLTSGSARVTSKGLPPGLEDFQAYITEKGYPEREARMCWHYWQSMGWKRGRNPIVNWKNAVNMWMIKEGIEAKPKRRKEDAEVSLGQREAAVGGGGSPAQGEQVLAPAGPQVEAAQRFTPR